MIKPKKQKIDFFTMLVKKELGVTLIKEYHFHPTRQWRFDYCSPEHKIALEVEGGAWTNGRHTRGKGFIGDMEKYNEAVLLGWKIVRVVPTELTTNNTILLVKRLLLC